MTPTAPAPPRETGGTSRRGSDVRRLVIAVLVALATAMALMTTTQAPAQAAAVSLRDRFSRETVRPGDADLSPYHIDHVYELQYRLRWLGLFRVAPTGNYGSVTRAAVIRFQKRNGIRATGVVGPKTWRPLIMRTVRGRAPSVCRTSGWHACYDRSRHQVSLYRSGVLWNSWLVRGGGYSTPTRTGNFTVFLRDIDHYSARYSSPMPYSQFFSGGQALHGSRLMMDPFVGHSHGCVNFWTEDAGQLWSLTASQTLRVHVYGAWG